MEEQKDVNGRTLTYGEKAVGLTFNPSGDDQVSEIKLLCANVIDFCNTVRAGTADKEVARMMSVAITEAQTAQMWAVKALTWK